MALPNNEEDVTKVEIDTEAAEATEELNNEPLTNNQRAENKKDNGFILLKRFCLKINSTRSGRIFTGVSLFAFLLLFALIGSLASSASSSSIPSQPAAQEVATKSPVSSSIPSSAAFFSYYFPEGNYDKVIIEEEQFRNEMVAALTKSFDSLGVNDTERITILELRKGSLIVDVEVVTLEDVFNLKQASGSKDSFTTLLVALEEATKRELSQSSFLSTLTGSSLQVYVGKLVMPTLHPTYSPTLNPTLRPTEMPTTTSPTLFPTTIEPTPYVPPTTLFPSTSPTTNPTSYPTKSPTKNPTTREPTVFPTPSPIDLRVEASYTCETDEIEKVVDLFLFQYFENDNLNDVDFDTDGYLNSYFESTIGKLLKHRLTHFRASASLPQESQFGTILGKYINSGTWSNVKKNLDFSIYNILSSCGYKVAHFGKALSAENEELLKEMNLDNLVLSNDPSEIKEKVKMYFENNNIIKYRTKYVIFIYWPAFDVYNNIGADYLDLYNQNNHRIYGISGVGDRFGDVCKDIVREDDDDALFRLLSDNASADDYRKSSVGIARNTDTERRYLICARQLYLVNMKLELEAVYETLQLIDNMDREGVNVFTYLSSNTGPLNPAKFPTYKAKNRFRGFQGSLYEGGLRIPFYFNLFINRNPIKFEDYSLEKLSGVSSPTALNAVDILPTVLSLAKVSMNNVLSSYFDGIVMTSYIKEKEARFIDRNQVQYFEKAMGTLETCIDDSPSLAILDNSGRFKLMVTPPALTKEFSELGKNVDSMNHVELYDLQYSQLEKINWYNANTVSKTLAGNIKELTEHLYSKLYNLVKAKGLSVERYQSTGCDNLYETSANSKNVASGKVSGNRNSVSSSIKGMIVILTDDMGHSDASIYGKLEKNSRDKSNSFFMANTPNIDSLAENGGFVFTDFYSNSAVCSPSRAALLTGKYPSHVFNRVHSAVPVQESVIADKGVVSHLGEDFEEEHFNMNVFFKEQGFVTGHFGKWHLGFNGPYVDDKMYGLDQYQVYAARDFPDEKKRVNFPTSQNTSKYYDTEFDNADLMFSSVSSKKIIDRSIDFIKERKAMNEKFVINIWLQNAHAPLNLALEENKVDAFNYTLTKNRASSAKIFSENQKLQTGLEVYRTLLAQQDKAIGDLIDYLKKCELIDDTVVFYSSDNGAETIDKYFHSVGNSYSHFRGYKRSLYEGGIRVPGLLHVGKFGAENMKVIQKPMSLIDIFPTFVGLTNLNIELENSLSALQAKVPKYSLDTFRLQGRDLSCLIYEDCHEIGQAKSIEDDIIIFEWRETNSGGDCLGWSSRFALRYLDYKIHLEPKSSSRRDIRGNRDLDSEYSRLEVYDVVKDPSEMTNLWLTQRKDERLSSMIENVVNYLAEFTQRESYDVSLFPRSRRSNIDYSTGSFARGFLCTLSLIGDYHEPNYLPWISSSFMLSLENS